MILLDTDVLTEPLKPHPAPAVIAWLDDQVVDQLCISAVTVMVMLDGAACLGVGARGLRLEEAVNSLIARFRCLPFDEFAARSYVQTAERARRAGHTIHRGNAQLAAVAHANGIEAVATRGTGPFEAMGLKVINPWTA
ncbi:VapC toxin family PIN domain ribonuclease [Variovorax sp. WS11]|uniref:PIN domain-containing protein n=1 Tax=Variovorax sp. WS11 TaxID=1105204 RepID=UPI000D0DB580|nr:PIN domain-containing protein [Variovorax sp. WS11]NDZ17236.1 type II toxin-antitoxin system VapC family toxin [Variovorax sp. WS11]PSL81088.1 VapC toxin family PIN domain ribonuclease [Variovorax sp. WS11]